MDNLHPARVPARLYAVYRKRSEGVWRTQLGVTICDVYMEEHTLPITFVGPAPHSVLVISPTRVAPRSVYPSRPTWATLSLSCVGSAGVGMVEEGAERLKRCSNGLSAPSSRHAHPTRALHVACIPHRDPSRSLRVPGMPHTQAPAMPDVA